MITTASLAPANILIKPRTSYRAGGINVYTTTRDLTVHINAVPTVAPVKDEHDVVVPHEKHDLQPPARQDG